MFFDAAVDPTVTNKTPGPGRDILDGELEQPVFRRDDATHLETFTERYGLNSRLTADNGRLVEEVYRIGGRYDREIRRDRRSSARRAAVRDAVDGARRSAR